MGWSAGFHRFGWWWGTVENVLAILNVFIINVIIRSDNGLKQIREKSQQGENWYLDCLRASQREQTVIKIWLNVTKIVQLEFPAYSPGKRIYHPLGDLAGSVAVLFGFLNSSWILRVHSYVDEVSFPHCVHHDHPCLSHQQLLCGQCNGLIISLCPCTIHSISSISHSNLIKMPVRSQCCCSG